MNNNNISSKSSSYGGVEVTVKKEPTKDLLGNPKELTFVAILLGIVVGVVMTAANVYLGLYAGMTVGASIPAAVIAIGLFKVILRRTNILEANIVQTMASAGESLAAGIIFTVPAIVLLGIWTEFDFWTTTIIAMSGGILGVVFMIPLRKALIVDDKTLKYPEGVACAAVLETATAKAGGGVKVILWGLGIGAIVKFFSSGLKILKGGLESAGIFGGKVFFMGFDASPALISVGYIVKLEIAAVIFLGGLIGWTFGIPLLSSATGAEGAAVDTAWTLWTSQIRYLGVGAMIVGGVWSVLSVSKGIAAGIGSLASIASGKAKDVIRTERDMSLYPMLGLMAAAMIAMLVIYNQVLEDTTEVFLTTGVMFLASFLFVAVSSYIVGLVGSSNNPVSGMTISALLGTAIMLFYFGYTGDSAILATLGVAAIVCCAACTSGDCSQDLKTGSIVGATPWKQQIAQVIGVLIPAFVIAPVLTVLHGAYTIGSKELAAPQAGLFASLAKGFFDPEGSIPMDMVYYGMALGVVVIGVDLVLKAMGSKFRLYLMPLAIGIYLPITLTTPIFLGGLIRYLVDRKRGEVSEGEDKGILLASGFIAGEAVLGVVIACFVFFGLPLALEGVSEGLSIALTTLVFIAVMATLYFVSLKKLTTTSK